MDDQRVGAAFRAVRIRRGWRQTDLAKKARVGTSVISMIERGHLVRVSPPAFRSVAGALEIRVDIRLTLPHGELERLINAGHALLHESLARYFEDLPGWVHAPEASFAVYGERGIIDILAFHPASGSLLVIELKTEFVSLEDLLSTMDVRLRHASVVAAQRGWRATTVNAWVVFAASDINRRRVFAHKAALRAAFASDGHAIRAWLRSPSGSIRALSFWANSADATATKFRAGGRRVRMRETRSRVVRIRSTDEIASVEGA